MGAQRDPAEDDHEHRHQEQHKVDDDLGSEQPRRRHRGRGHTTKDAQMKRSSSACDMAAPVGGATARTGSVRGPVLARRFRETVITDENR